jgi:hypothetical protein
MKKLKKKIKKPKENEKAIKPTEEERNKPLPAPAKPNSHDVDSVENGGGWGDAVGPVG